MNKVLGGKFEDCPIKLDGTLRCLYVQTRDGRYYFSKDNVASYEVKESKTHVLSPSELTCLVEWNGGKKSVILLDKVNYTFLVNGCELFESEIDPDGKKRKRSLVSKVIGISILVIMGLFFFFILNDAHQRDLENRTTRLSFENWNGITSDVPETKLDTALHITQNSPEHSAVDDTNSIRGKLYNNSRTTYTRLRIYFEIKDTSAEVIDTCETIQDIKFTPKTVWNFDVQCENKGEYPEGSYIMVRSIQGRP